MIAPAALVLYAGLAAAAPAVAATPVASSAAGVAVRRVKTRKPVVALTFDACATSLTPEGFDQAVFDFLKRERLDATVFMSGRWIEAHPDAARAVAAEPRLELGNHSWSHHPFSPLSTADAGREIDEAEARIAGLGRSSVAFRPPFGDWSTTLLGAARERGLPIVLWDVVSLDAGGHFKPATMIEAVTHKVRPGSIVVFHINGRGTRTKDALPAIVQRLRRRGMRFVKISELLALRGARIETAEPAQYKAHEPRAPSRKAARSAK